jgi:hypothetical protein
LSYSSIIQYCVECHKALYIANERSNIIKCSCGTTNLLADISLGQISLPAAAPHLSIIQVGTTGVYKTKIFTVLGLCRLWHYEAVWNFWFIEWADGSHGYLGEAYGLYTLLAEEHLKMTLDSSFLSFKELGGKIHIADFGDYLLESKLQTYHLEVLGEVYLQHPKEPLTIAECADENGDRFTLFCFDGKPIQYWKTSVVDYSLLHLKNTTSSIEAAKEVVCKQCKEKYKFKAYPYSNSYSCPNCRTYHRLDANGNIHEAGRSMNTILPDIEVGRIGKFDGLSYQVVGFCEKQENNAGASRWREYALYNSTTGFIFLSEYDGHWIFLKETLKCPVIYNVHEDFVFGNELYQRFNAYRYTVKTAVGEFPYNLFNNAKTRCNEYIRPPFIWVLEGEEKEGVKWFLGNHISPREVNKAFDNQLSMPYRVGTGAVQPAGFGLFAYIKIALITILAVLGVFYLTTLSCSERVLFELDKPFNDSTNKLTFVTDKYGLNKRKSNIRLDIQADVSNSWVEVAVTLVNTETGKEYNVEQGIEYYYGYSDGENWSEGNTANNTYFKKIPAGTYFMEVEATRDSGAVNRAGYVTIKATYDVLSMRNLWWSLVLALFYPTLSFIFNRYKEDDRWGNSPFKPQTHDE